MNTPDSKKCSGRCGEVKPLEMFSLHKKGLYGRRSRCKICESEYNKLYSKTDSFKQSQKKYQSKPTTMKKNRITNLRKYHAHSGIWNTRNKEFLKTPAGKAYQAKQCKRIVDRVTDAYIAGIIGIPVTILRRHPEYIEAKRQQILLKRYINNQQNPQ